MNIIFLIAFTLLYSVTSLAESILVVVHHSYPWSFKSNSGAIKGAEVDINFDRVTNLLFLTTTIPI